MFYEKLKKEHERVSEKVDMLTHQLQFFPKGKLCISKNGKYYKWRLVRNGKQITIPKSKRAIAEQMALKNLYTTQLQKYQKEQRALEACLAAYEKSRREEQDIYAHPEMRTLLRPHHLTELEDLQIWEEQPYEKYMGHPEQLTFKTEKGEYVRSKSEALIAMYLYHSKIPYRYECGIDIGTRHIYPDFTTRHPRTGQTIYWEHHGLMEKPSYVNDVAQKIKTYASIGIYPFENLIMTYERSSHPLDIAWVEKIIAHYYF